MTNYERTHSAAATSLTAKAKASAATTSTTEDKKVSKLTESASELKTSADALLASGEGSVFESSYKEGDPSDMVNYDSEKVTNALKSFVKSYNDTLDNAASSSNAKLSRTVSSMQNNTQANKNLLSKVGITVVSDGKLSLDESKVKTANAQTLKNLFNEENSFGAKTKDFASQINGYSAQDDGSSAKNSYSANGAYNKTGADAGSLYSAYL